MSKNTKIIAIVGGILIVVGLIWIVATPGGFGAAFEAVGCGGEKDKDEPRMQMDLETKELNDCRARNKVYKRDAEGNVVKKGGKPVVKGEREYCTKLWAKKCKDPKFAASYKKTCAKKLKEAQKVEEDYEE